MKALTQISVRLSGHPEESVSELFESIFQQGPSIYTDADTGVSTASVYLDKPLSASARVELSAGLRELAPKSPKTKIVQKTVRRENWAESWKKHFKPLEVSSSLLIKPSWSKRKPRKGQAVVILDPGLSFGTGQHATTSFCLRQIVASRSTESRQSFLDIGTGSGILSIAAAKLGYSPVQAFDFDPESIRVARENSKQNKVEKLVALSQQDLTKLPTKSKQQHDVICANLIYDLLIAEAERIVNRLKPEGDLILAGILKIQFAKVKRAYAKLGFKLVATTQEKEWQSGHFKRVT